MKSKRCSDSTLDKTKNRQLVRAYFELYRQYCWLLEMDMEPHREQPRARPGYENAMDPRFIHMHRCDETQPTDDKTYMTLYNHGWYVGKRYYEQEKAKAVMLMAASFRIEQYRERLSNM